jgi:hypothetical protein
MQGFLAIFSIDDAYFASQDLMFLQMTLSILVKLFERIGLETNRLKARQGPDSTANRFLPSHVCMNLTPSWGRLP